MLIFETSKSTTSIPRAFQNARGNESKKLQSRKSQLRINSAYFAPPTLTCTSTRVDKPDNTLFLWFHRGHKRQSKMLAKGDVLSYLALFVLLLQHRIKDRKHRTGLLIPEPLYVVPHHPTLVYSIRNGRLLKLQVLQAYMFQLIIDVPSHQQVKWLRAVL